MLIQQYLKDTYQSNHNSKITNYGTDDKGQFLVLEDTIFYPQGGGQPFDTGAILIESNQFSVTSVFYSPSRVDGQDAVIKHYGSFETEFLPNIDDEVSMNIDLPNRLVNAKNHTAGHLLGFAVEKLTGVKGKKGFHFPEGCYVEFDGIVEINPEIVAKTVNEYITDSLPIIHRLVDAQEYVTLTGQEVSHLPFGKPIRIMETQNLGIMGCGGTHIQNTSEISEFTIRKISNKKGVTKISYTAI
jgi:alanyl-tRNA synthetase